MSPRILGGIVSAALCVAVFFWYSSNYSRFAVNRNPELHRAIEGMENAGVPEITGKTIQGDHFSLASLRGKIVIVNFWATWCNPCAKEFPSIFSLIKKFEGNVVLVAISNDESLQDIEPFLAALGGAPPNVKVIWDPKRQIADLYGVQKLPESFLVGKDGKLLRKIIGTENWFTEASISFFASLTN